MLRRSPHRCFFVTVQAYEDSNTGVLYSALEEMGCGKAYDLWRTATHTHTNRNKPQSFAHLFFSKIFNVMFYFVNGTFHTIYEIFKSFHDIKTRSCNKICISKFFALLKIRVLFYQKALNNLIHMHSAFFARCNL